MTDTPAHVGPTDHSRDDITAEDYDQVDGEAVENADPDLTVPGESDIAESGGQGADHRYVEGGLGGGAIGASIDDDAHKSDEMVSDEGLTDENNPDENKPDENKRDEQTGDQS